MDGIRLTDLSAWAQLSLATASELVRDLQALGYLERRADGTDKRAKLIILRGAPVPLDPNVELVAYRIVQEALTNARRHAPGAAVDVELTFADAELQLRVRDNGPGPDPSGPLGGHGVEGMHERAAAVGGTARTGAAPGVGYLVEAILPAKVETPP